MSSRRYTSTCPTQPPARSILKPSRSIHTSVPHSSHSSTIAPAVKVRDPLIPTQAAQRAVQSLQDVPLNGPIPAFYLPPTQNRQQLVKLLYQFASQLEADGIGAEDDRERQKKLCPQAGRPTYQADEFLEFRQTLMGPWVPGPCYAPVLEPEVAMKLPVLQVHRYLSPPTTGTKGYIHWDVTQPASTAIFIEDGKAVKFGDFCRAPVTSPRITTFQLISESIPWPSSTTARNELAGVTIGELLSSLSAMLTAAMTLDRIVQVDSEEARTTLLRGHKERCPDGTDIPRVFDLLSGCTTFGGLTYDRERDFPDDDWEIHLFVHYLRGYIR